MELFKMHDNIFLRNNAWHLKANLAWWGGREDTYPTVVSPHIFLNEKNYCTSKNYCLFHLWQIVSASVTWRGKSCLCDIDLHNSTAKTKQYVKEKSVLISSSTCKNQPNYTPKFLKDVGFSHLLHLVCSSSSQIHNNFHRVSLEQK